MKKAYIAAALLLALSIPLSFSIDEEAPIDCGGLYFVDVQEACDYFSNPISDCVININDEFLANGYSDPNAQSTDTDVDLANNSGSSDAEAQTFMCRGGAGAGGGGGT